jgi:uncharacterized protein YbbC (DUF1343 family)
VLPGADVLAAEDWADLRGQKVGVITNPTGVTGTLTSIVDQMHDSGSIDVVAVFGPEHGFRGTGQAGDGEGDHVDPRTGIMVYDAYGASAAKFTELYRKSGVETVVFDIQDVGARFYTYIWLMYEAMAGAVGSDIRFVVLDRPNPIGGDVRGPMLREGFQSGVGKQPILQQHGMTVGELARFFDAELLPDTAGGRLGRLDVVRVRGWRRSMRYADTGLPWILPSPNMPTPDTALLYPGTCLFEATNLSEGRGTTRPFELIGAPYADYRWAHELDRLGLPGVRFREAYFAPTFSKYAGEVCAGVQVHIVDPRRVEAIAVATHMIVTAKRLYDAFDWRAGDTPHGRWIDLLTGSDRFRTMVDGGATAEEIIAAWRDEQAEFDRRRRPYLLYRG